jgi:hypothetical protein
MESLMVVVIAKDEKVDWPVFLGRYVLASLDG